jgi:hypothetical protein
MRFVREGGWRCAPVPSAVADCTIGAPEDSHDDDYEAHTDIVGGEEKIKKKSGTHVWREIWRASKNGG